MKTLLFIFSASVILLFSCTKTNVHQPEARSPQPFSATDVSTQAKNRFDLLTAHPWMYQGYYFHYIDQTHKGDVQYLRGGLNNIINLDATRIAFRKNGTFIELDGGYTYPGTWKFTDAADTVFIMTFSYGKDVNTIVRLDNNHLNYTMPIGSYSHNNFAYTELIAAQR